jgi:hypothetical protein
MYEPLVVASLRTITVRTYERCPVQNGIPFGLLTVAYRASGVVCIFPATFWRGAGHADLLRILFIVIMLLYTLAGLTSAILIGWFSLDNPFSNIPKPISQGPTIIHSTV